jgi:outer membrane immunogenic protein
MTSAGRQIPPSSLERYRRHQCYGRDRRRQAGYNFQLSPLWLIGIEADINYTVLSNGRIALLPPPSIPGTLANSTFESKWLATVRGRVGIIAAPGLLFYGTGGAAFADVKTSDLAFFLSAR